MDTNIDLIIKIANRFHEVESMPWLSRSFTHMTLLAVDRNHKIDWQRMLDGDDFNLVHDVMGMLRHYEPKTGQFTDCFLPRYTTWEQN